jgi:glycerophosphoryl diester phosphodiesterase
VPRSFLMGTPELAKRWLSPEGLQEVRTFATGVAPAKRIIERDPDIVRRAHTAGLTVVPYTFQLRPETNPYSAMSPEARKALADEYGSFPDTRPALTDEMRKFVEVYNVDGLFTNNPDLFPR